MGVPGSKRFEMLWVIVEIEEKFTATRVSYNSIAHSLTE
jgi:hypothetical protein